MALRKKSAGGAPPTLTQEIVDRVVEKAGLNASIRQLARVSCLHRENLRRWIEKGADDYQCGINSLYAELWVKVEQKIGNQIDELINHMKNLGTYQSTSWLLENNYREDFGKDAEDIKEIIENVNKLAARNAKRTARRKDGVDEA